MAMTLNSLAQGYITDAAADLLRNEGFETAFVDLGEIRAIGRHPDGRAWRVGIRDGRPAARPAQAGARGSAGAGVELADMAHGGVRRLRHHLRAVRALPPHLRSDRPATAPRALIDAAVIGPRATIANGLSTALCVAGEERAAALLAACPGYRAILTRPDGTRAEVGGAAV